MTSMSIVSSINDNDAPKPYDASATFLLSEVFPRLRLFFAQSAINFANLEKGRE